MGLYRDNGKENGNYYIIDWSTYSKVRSMGLLTRALRPSRVFWGTRKGTDVVCRRYEDPRVKGLNPKP